MWNDMQIEKVRVSWNGWTASISDLLDAGWDFERRLRFDYVKTGWGMGRKRIKGAYIVLKNEKLGVLGRLTYHEAMYDSTHTAFHLDFLTYAKAFRKRGTPTTPLTATDLGVGKEDIGELFDLIGELQKQYPVPQKAPSQVAEFKKVA